VHFVANCCILPPPLALICKGDSPYLETLPTTAFRMSIWALFAISGSGEIRLLQSFHVPPFDSRFITALRAGCLRLISCPRRLPFAWVLIP